ncbi:MAG: cytochrome c oxidase subunit 3 [Lautropia sp.]|nr:cytochrome c oxidase subunit 3 [Lautropia sp.]
MAVVVGWLLKQTMNVRPWVAQGTEDVHRDDVSPPAAKIGLWVFLAVVTSLFALFVSAYAMRMELGDWKPLPEPGLLWLNTGVLIATSVAMQWTRAAANRGHTDGVRIGLIAGGVLTFAFLAGQLVVWRQLNASGYPVVANPANAFFYLLTALHGLHLLGGLVVWGRATARLWRGIAVGEVRLSVELCTVYWHYLLLVWLVLFALLLST